jgi:transcriptional regulator with XRE-family HTH domain
MKMIGKRIKQVRLLRGWSLNNLSDKTDISKGSLSAVENRDVDMRISTLIKLAEALGVSISWLVYGDGHSDDGAFTIKGMIPVQIKSTVLMSPERYEKWQKGIDTDADT